MPRPKTIEQPKPTTEPVGRNVAAEIILSHLLLAGPAACRQFIALGLVKRGTIHATLSRMQVAGLVESRLLPRSGSAQALRLYSLTDPGRRRLATLRAKPSSTERHLALLVVDEARALCRSGYDGPFMGEPVAPLFKALAAYDAKLSAYEAQISEVKL